MSLYTNLISFWELEEASGTRVDAVVASGNDLTDVNTVTQNTGKVGNCAQFTSANSECLSHSNNASLTTGDIDFTIAGWVYFDSVSANESPWSKWTAGTEAEYALDDAGAGGAWRWYVYFNGSSADVLTSSAVPTTATWYYVVCWHDSIANTISIQVNDGTVDSKAHSTGVFQGTSAFALGSRGASAGEFMPGRIDQVGFWKRVLTSGERTQLYNSGAGLSYAAMAPASGVTYTQLERSIRGLNRGLAGER